jgi:hypothetical protein
MTSTCLVLFSAKSYRNSVDFSTIEQNAKGLSTEERVANSSLQDNFEIFLCKCKPALIQTQYILWIRKMCYLV